MNLIFFENSEQLVFFLNNHQKFNNHNLKYIALTPYAIRKLEELNLRFSYPEQYYNCEEEYKKLTTIFWDYNKKIIEYFDNLVIENDIKFRKENLKPFECFAYHFERLLNTIKIKLFELIKIIETEKPQKIYFFKTFKHSFDVDLQYSDVESIYYYLLIEICKKNWIDYEILESNFSETENKSKNNFFVLVLKKLHSWKFYFRKLKIFFKNHLNLTGRNILIISMRNVSLIKYDLIKSGYKIFVINNKKITKLFFKKSRYSPLLKDKIEKKLFEFLGINFFPLIESRLDFFLQRLENIFEIYEYYFKYLTKKKVKLIFADSILVTQFFANLILVSAAKKLKIPIAVWKHGGCFEDEYNIPLSWYLHEIRYCDYYFLYGNKQIEIFKKYDKLNTTQYSTVGCQFIVNGAIKSKKTIKNKDLEILYIIKDFTKTNQVFLNFDSKEMFINNVYYYFLRDTIKVLNQKFPEQKIIIKGFFKETKELIKDFLNIPKIQFITNEFSLPELLNKNVLVICDYLSTSLMESIYSKKDIILHTKLKTDYPLIIDYLNESVIISKSIDELKIALDNYLKNNSIEKNNNRFLNDFLNINLNIDNKKKIISEIDNIFISRGYKK
ncbi:MAG TPA: hypothetical protein PLD27_12515 [bacterium]|nr:hypothetical protein [bacterium]